MWKSTLKHYHAEKNFRQTTRRKSRNLNLQMDEFLPLGGISGLFALNIFWGLPFILDLKVKNIL